MKQRYQVRELKEQLARVMEEHHIDWEKKGTHEEHLSVMDYKKQERSKELEELEAKVEDRKIDYTRLRDRVDNLEETENVIFKLRGNLLNDPEYQLQEPAGFMTAKSYKSKIVEPLIDKLKETIRDITAKYYDMRDSYYSVSGRIGRLEKENSSLERKVQDLKEDNAVLREDVKDLRIIKRAMRPQAFEDLLNQAKAAAQEREWGR